MICRIDFVERVDLFLFCFRKIEETDLIVDIGVIVPVHIESIGWLIRIQYARDVFVGWFEFDILYVLLLVKFVDIGIRLAFIRIRYRVWVSGRRAVAI